MMDLEKEPQHASAHRENYEGNKYICMNKLLNGSMEFVVKVYQSLY